MAEPQENWDKKDPSDNVLRLVGDTVDYFEKLIEITKQNMSETTKLQNDFIYKAFQAETSRVNACRLDDKQALQTANDRANKQQETLAQQVSENAEVLRSSNEKMAFTLATQLQEMTSLLMNRIEKLEAIQFENKGKEGSSASLLKDVAELKTTVANQEGSKGTSFKLQLVIATALGGVAMGIVIWVLQTIKI
ncbi:hypothetical protein [Acetobacterium sp.]|uniref:hypothetical protein n=1 Tax=Acetobacterium sp. TaxID=1872094 RepID=UPI002F413593